MSDPRLQLVVPCYNEAARLKPEAFLEFVTSNGETGLLFVDDGSTDDTRVILADLVARGEGRIAVLSLDRNVGKAGAVQRGLLAAFAGGTDFAGYWDADLATPLGAVAEFVNVLDAKPEIDIVMGARVKLLGRDIRRGLGRHYCGRLFATAASVLLRVDVYDTQCGAKVFRASPAIAAILRQPFESKWIFDVEILARYIASAGAARAEAAIYEVPLRRWVHVAGSKLGLWQAAGAVWDLAKIWRKLMRAELDGS